MQQHRIIAELDAATGALGFAISTLERIQAGQEVDITSVITLLGRVRRNAPKCAAPVIETDTGTPALKRVYHELRMTLETLDGLSPTGASAQGAYNSLVC